jgi:hypothetical protein
LNKVPVVIVTNDAKGKIVLFHGEIKSDNQLIGDEQAIKSLLQEA